jgi:hypothetical protein
MVLSELNQYSVKISAKEKKRLKELLQGVDGIDASKIVKTKQVVNNEHNLYIPEKWIYRLS